MRGREAERSWGHEGMRVEVLLQRGVGVQVVRMTRELRHFQLLNLRLLHALCFRPAVLEPDFHLLTEKYLLKTRLDLRNKHRQPIKPMETV